MIKKKENEYQSKDLDFFLRQEKDSYFNQHENISNIRNFFIYKKLWYFYKNYYNVKKKDRKNANSTCNDFDGDDYILMLSKRVIMVAMSKQIVDLDATKHMILYKYSFDNYEEIPTTRI